MPKDLSPFSPHPPKGPEPWGPLTRLPIHLQLQFPFACWTTLLREGSVVVEGLWMKNRKSLSQEQGFLPWPPSPDTHGESQAEGGAGRHQNLAVPKPKG